MFKRILVKLSLTVVIAVMNVSLAFCQIGVVDVISRQVPGEGKKVSISPVINGETEIVITQDGQVILETVASKSAIIPLLFAPGVYRIVATHRLTERREIRLVQLEE